MRKYANTIEIQGQLIGKNYPTYFIADIAANHDGDLERAKDLIWKAKDAGADAAKFQHFRAETIVSDYGFKSLEGKQSHQSTWKKSVFEVYKSASVSIDWTEALKEVCHKAGITFFTSPYDFDLVDEIDPFVPAYKIGSGDITWTQIIEHIAGKGKPYILATGASTLDDVVRAVDAGLAKNPNIALLQCNTNYTGSLENMKYIQLNVLRTYQSMFPEMVLGLSDHTPGDTSVLGAIALGARLIEKHFTDNKMREGPDHKFSMDPLEWRKMVYRTRELEAALGSGVKEVEPNEKETVILQRRAIRLKCNKKAGEILELRDTVMLRPCPEDAMTPDQINKVIGWRIKKDKLIGDYLRAEDFEHDL